MSLNKQYLIYVCGLSATGKTSFSKRLVNYFNQNFIPTVLVDKDVLANKFVRKGLELMGANPNDRDSPFYKEHFRDLEYEVTLDMIQEQLKMGLSCVAPAPWTKEIKNEMIFQNFYQTPNKLYIKHVFLKSSQERMKEVILKRKNPMDEWKLNNWEEFIKSQSDTTTEDLIFSKGGLVLTSDKNKKIEDIVKNLGLNI